MTDEEAVAAICDQHPGIGPTQARLVHILQEGRVATKSYGKIAERMRDLCGEYPSKGSIRTAARRARAHGYIITATYDIGYRLEKTDA